jgi:ketosteroid isomerase-like protein
MPAAHVWKIGDGKITHFQQLADSVHMNGALAVEATA